MLFIDISVGMTDQVPHGAYLQLQIYTSTLTAYCIG